MEGRLGLVTHFIAPVGGSFCSFSSFSAGAALSGSTIKDLHKKLMRRLMINDSETMTVLDDVGWDYLGKVLKRPFLSSESDPVPWKRLGEGLGFLSEVFTTDVPKTADRGDLEKVVLKLQLPKAEDGDTSEAASLSRFVEAMGIHIQELRFYKDVVVDTLPVPHPLHTDVDRGIIIMTFCDGYIRDCREGLNLQETRSALRSIAHIHAISARRYSNSELGRKASESEKDVAMRSLPHDFCKKPASYWANAFLDMAPSGVAKFSDVLRGKYQQVGAAGKLPAQTEVEEGLRYLEENIDREGLEKMMDEDFTDGSIIAITNGDLWGNNCLMSKTTDKDLPTTWIVDWQWCRWQSVARDITFLLLSSSQRLVLEHHYEACLRFYFDELQTTSQRVEQLDCWRSIRRDDVGSFLRSCDRAVPVAMFQMALSTDGWWFPSDKTSADVLENEKYDDIIYRMAFASALASNR